MVMATLADAEVASRIRDLHEAWSPYMYDRIRIRQIMDGGQEAIVALLGQRAAARLNDSDLPVVHLMDAGLQRLAQRLGRPPTVKVDPVGVPDSDRSRKRAEKRERIVKGLDYETRLELTFPYAGRWMPGYGFVPWVITEGIGRSGDVYAKAEIRNPFDCYPGQWGADNQPEEIAFIRMVSKRKLAANYPVYRQALEAASQTGQYSRVWWAGQQSWEGNSSDLVMVGEYMCRSGTYLMAMDTETLLDIVPNPIPSGPPFVLAKRPSFNVLRGQYDHVIGLMAMMAKLNVLAYIATEDATFRETNIIGDLLGQKYERGRFATNFFTPGTQIERPTADVAFQVFTQIDRIERQLRIGANYSVVEDSESPNQFVTGRGLDKLTTSASANVSEYQLYMRDALERLDSKRLEWEEHMYGDRSKRVVANAKGLAIDERYVPSRHIKGEYLTRRVYGMMAGWDEPEKIVTGLQLLQAEALDTESFQENLDGLENISRINERVRAKKAETGLFAILEQQAVQGDPRAQMTMVEIYKNPANVEAILTKFYTPEEPQMSPEEMMLAQGMGMPGGPGGMPGGGPEAAMGGPEAVSTVLSRILGGRAEGGVQTVGQL